MTHKLIDATAFRDMLEEQKKSYEGDVSMLGVINAFQRMIDKFPGVDVEAPDSEVVQ